VVDEGECDGGDEEANRLPDPPKLDMIMSAIRSTSLFKLTRRPPQPVSSDTGPL
jgi:hypothetical protein